MIGTFLFFKSRVLGGNINLKVIFWIEPLFSVILLQLVFAILHDSFFKFCSVFGGNIFGINDLVVIYLALMCLVLIILVKCI
jgi:hypothetical protein